MRVVPAERLIRFDFRAEYYNNVACVACAPVPAKIVIADGSFGVTVQKSTKLFDACDGCVCVSKMTLWF